MSDHRGMSDHRAAERAAANARSREAIMSLMHIEIDSEPSLVACGEDRLPGMRVGTRAEVGAADEGGCFACIDAWYEAAYMSADLRAKGML
jgi:hypothetical protein